jgi:type II secretory pathway pseudopilin PulG
MITILIIGILLGIAVPQWMQVRKKSQETVRGSNCKAIDRAKETWIQEKGKLSNDVPTEADLVPEYLQQFPNDPGGTFVIHDGMTPCEFIPN